MGFFSFFTRNKQSKNTQIQTSTLNGNLDSLMFKPISYTDAQNIYLYFPLGNRIVNLPINLAFCNFQNGLEDLPLYKELDIPFLIDKAKEFIRNVKIYGLGALLPITSDKDNISEPILKTSIYDANLRFNVIDPMQMNISIDTDPTSYAYRKIKDIYINGKVVDNGRILVLQNQSLQLNLQYNEASFSWSGLSIYQNLYPILNLLNTSLVSLERQMLFSSLLILTQGNLEISGNINQKNLEEQGRILANARQNSVLILKNGLNLEQFKLENLSPIESTLSNINNLLAMSSDIPSLVFSGEKLSNGFTEGDAELELLNLYLDNIRNEFVIPTMKYLLTYQIYNKIKNISEREAYLNKLDITFKPVTKQEYKKEDDKYPTLNTKESQ